MDVDVRQICFKWNSWLETTLAQIMMCDGPSLMVAFNRIECGELNDNNKIKLFIVNYSNIIVHTFVMNLNRCPSNRPPPFIDSWLHWRARRRRETWQKIILNSILFSKRFFLFLPWIEWNISLLLSCDFQTWLQSNHVVSIRNEIK